MRLVAVLQPAENGDGILDARWVDQDRLEPSLQSRILLDVLAVLVDGRGPDAAKLATRQGRLEQVAGVHRPLGLARSHDNVQLVDEQNDLSLGADDLLEHGLEPVLELAAELRPGDQGPHIECDDALVLQPRRHIARDDPLRQALDDGGLAHARLTDQDGIVLGPPVEDLHAPPNFLIPADDRVELAFARHLDQVDAVALQSLVLILRILVRDLGPAANILQGILDLLRRDGVEAQDLLGVALGGGQGQEQVLRAEVLIAHLVGPVLRVEDDLVERRIGHHLAAGGALRQAIDLAFRHLSDAVHVGADLLEDHLGHAALVAQQGAEQVQRRQHGMRLGHRDLLCRSQRLLGFQCESIEFHR
jgi:hypothetical protein